MSEYDQGGERRQAPVGTPPEPAAGPDATVRPPGAHPGPVTGHRSAGGRRPSSPPLGSTLDRDVWVWMLVVGAVVLVVLMLL